MLPEKRSIIREGTSFRIKWLVLLQWDTQKRLCFIDE